MTLLAFPSLQTVFDINGKPVRGAQVYFYAAGTNSPIQVHKVATLDSAYAQPIPVSGLGRFPPIFTNAAEYRIRIVDQYGGILEDIDGISGTEAGGGGGGGVVGVVDANSLLMTGDILFNLSSGARVGFVRLNGRTISKAGGSGTERANDDLHALFVYLWNAIASLTVVGGRGANAEADWSAVKQLTLPDLRGRGPMGADAMGSTAAGRFTGGLLSSGTADGIGSVGGEPSSTAPLPAHSHTINYQNASLAGGANIVPLPTSIVATGTIPTSSTGAGGTHNNLSPFIIGTYYIRL